MVVILDYLFLEILIYLIDQCFSIEEVLVFSVFDNISLGFLIFVREISHDYFHEIMERDYPLSPTELVYYNSYIFFFLLKCIENMYRRSLFWYEDSGGYNTLHLKIRLVVIL